MICRVFTLLQFWVLKNMEPVKIKKFYLIVLGILTLTGCKKEVNENTKSPVFAHSEKNSVYYWKTVFEPDSTDYDMIEDLDIGKFYLRMFDVDIDPDINQREDRTLPVGTLRIPYDTYHDYRNKMKSVSFVPTVYITLEALKDLNNKNSEAERVIDKEGALARNIVERVKNMCSYNEIPNVKGLQLDCDWTRTTEESFFRLCEKVRNYIQKENLPWELSSTIRLHQLYSKAPPVDYGVLMVYNTGNFSDPNEKNSIISEENVDPYLKHLKNYPLHLDVAYPTYSWQLLFRNREFKGLINGIELMDTVNFSQKSENEYIALKDIPYNGKTIFKGDIIKQEISHYDDIVTIKNKIEEILKNKPHSNILYHFDRKNLDKYTYAELKNIFKTGQSI